MSDAPDPNDLPRDSLSTEGLPTDDLRAGAPQKGIGLMGWLLFLGVVGLFIYSRFFSGAPC